MPTGYTAAIADGITFEQFVWSCSRAFGALVSMRDEPQGAIIPEKFEPSDFSKKKLEELRAERTALLALSEEEAELKAAAEYEAEIEQRDRAIEKSDNLRRAYEDMLQKVNYWDPPTRDHEGLKKFMIEQLQTSIAHDCNMTYYREKRIIKLSGADWREQALVLNSRDTIYYEKDWKEEVERTNQRNAWIQALRDGLTFKVD